MIEVNLGLLAACLPTLRGLLKTKTMDTLLKSYRSRTWLRSSQRSRSGKSSGETESLPLTNGPSHTEKHSASLHGDKYPHDITLATLDSVLTVRDKKDRC